MSKFSQNQKKIEITKNVLEQVPHIQLTPDRALINWWFHTNGGFRLSQHGYRIFNEHLKLKAYTFEVLPSDANSAKFLIDADRKLQSPYFINFKEQSIIIFGSKEASAITLCGSNVKEYLQNYC